jgi:limonene-1,2-epoxide hydrolase
MPTPTETVTAFFAATERPGGLARGVREYFTPDTLWENVGMSKTTGPDQAVGLLAGMGGDPESFAMRVDLLSIAADGGKVLTERVDHILDAEGKSVMVVPVMGVFEVVDGKFALWRDYFDTSAMRA